jgi:hypothetical protein
VNQLSQYPRVTELDVVLLHGREWLGMGSVMALVSFARYRDRFE